jgi:hypothetical protein
MKKSLWLALTLILSMTAASCAQKSETPAETPSDTPAMTGARVEDRMLKRWMMGLMSRRENMTQTKATHLGDGPMEVTLPEEMMTWEETADVDSSGTTETVTMLWDETNKVFYAFTRDPIRLAGGSMADQGLMVAQFGEGNTQTRVPGSGWYAYVTSRDTTSAGDITGTLFGCRFDNNGMEQACGVGRWERNTNEFVLEIESQ